MDCDALSQICAQSLMQRSKPSRSSFYLREWKAGRLMRLQSGAISSPSRGQRFLDAWTSSLAVIPASHSHPPASDSEHTTSDTSGQLSQLAFGFCDQESVSLKTSKDTSPLGYGKSSMSWEAWVTERRGDYSARLKSVLHTNVSGCSSWPTCATRDYKGESGSGRQERKGHPTDTLPNAVARYGLPAPEIPSTDGSRRELSAEVQNPQWATPQTRDNRSGGAERWDDPNRSRNLNDQIATVTKQNAKLNPRWVEALMGLPVGWVMPSCAFPVTIEPTSCGSWGMELSQQPPQELLPF